MDGTDRHLRHLQRMRVRALVSSIVTAAGLGVGLVACNRGPSPLPLPGTLRAHLNAERFGPVTSSYGLPMGVRDALQELFGGPSLDIADPGAEFEGTGAAAGAGLPTRRLVAAGCSIDHCLVYYERGGSAHTWRVALFHWTPAETRFEWGGAAPGGLQALEDVRRAVASGKITSPDKAW